MKQKQISNLIDFSSNIKILIKLLLSLLIMLSVSTVMTISRSRAATTTVSLVPTGAYAGYLYNVAGDGSTTISGDGGPALSAGLYSPQGITTDSKGNLYICDGNLRMVPAVSGTYFGQPMTAKYIYSIAGNGTSASVVNGESALSAEIYCGSVAIDTQGNVYILGGKIFMVPAVSGTYFGQAMTADDIYTIAGNGIQGYSGDGGPAIDAEMAPRGITVDTKGNLYIADRYNERVRMVPARSGTFYGQSMIANDIYTIAGTGGTSDCVNGYLPTGPASSAELCGPMDVKVDFNGNLIISDQLSGIQVIPTVSGTYYGQSVTAGDIYTIAGNGISYALTSSGATAISTPVNPGNITIDPKGNIVIAGYFGSQVIFLPYSSGTYFGYPMVSDHIYVIGGNGSRGCSMAGNQPILSAIDDYFVTADSQGNVFVDTCIGIGVIPMSGVSSTPSAPTNLSAIPASSSIGLSWIAQGDNGAGVTDYKITATPTNNSGTPTGAASTVIDTASSSTSTTLTSSNLTAGTTYIFSVTAINANGSSPSSATTAPITFSSGIPGPPLTASATAGNGSLSLSWSAPASSGTSAVSDYLVTYWPTNGLSTTIDTASTSTSYNLIGLSPGTTYSVVVTAVNSTGDGQASNIATATTYAPPSAPNAPSVNPSSSGMVLNWSAPSDNGSPITDYQVEVSANGGSPTTIDTASTSTSYTVTGLSLGTSYSFTVTASNVAGTGSLSPSSATIVDGVPSIPNFVQAESGNGLAELLWMGPYYSGASPITNYVATEYPQGGTPVVVDTGSNNVTANLTGLTNNTSYSFSVAAENSYGVSPSAESSFLVTPAALPGPPVGIQYINVSNGTIGGSEVAFAPPTVDGLGATSYSITGNCTGSTGGSFIITATTTSTFGGVGGSGITGCTITDVTSYDGTTQGGSTTQVSQTSSFNLPPLAFSSIGAESLFPGSITLGWNYSNDTGNQNIDGYVIVVNPSSGNSFSINPTNYNTGTLGTDSGTTINGLNPNLTYSFAVYPHDSVGWSQPNLVDPTPDPAAPNAPTNLTAVGSNESAMLNWSAPLDNGSPITDYIITPTGGTPIDTHSNLTLYDVTGLTNGTTYTFEVEAINSVGTSPNSAISNEVTPEISSPLAPTSLTATTTNGTVNLTWAPPSNNGGSPITGYMITATPGGTTTNITGNVNSASLSGLSLGTPYTFAVSSVNSIGQGPSSNPSNIVIPTTVPSAPSTPTAIAGDGSATVSFSIPANNGGSPITSYTVTSSSGASVSVSGTATSGVVTGLTNGTSYTFSVTAQNIDGNSLPSSPSNAVTPRSGYPYHSLSPIRILDTRSNSGITGAGSTLGPNSTYSLVIAGHNGVPLNATAVVLNVTATDTTAWSFLTVYPTGEPLPIASNLNWTSAGSTVANLVEVPLGVNGAVSFYNGLGSTDVIADLSGYVAPSPLGSTAGLLDPVTPVRICDTRNNSNTTQCKGNTLTSGAPLTIQVTGVGGIPTSGVSAVVVNLTATNVTANTFLTVWPAGTALPKVSNLNLNAGLTRANRAIIQLSSTGAIQIENALGSADVTVDVVGYFTDGTNPKSTGLLYNPVIPARVADTRTGSLSSDAGQSVGPGQSATVNIDGQAGIPTTGPVVIVANITVTNTTTWSYGTVYASGTTMPNTSDINWTNGGQNVANLTFVEVGTNGAISFTNAFGSTDLVVDVYGWYG